jgi:hypothetical protein
MTHYSASSSNHLAQVDKNLATFSLIQAATRKLSGDFLLPEDIWREALDIYLDEFLYLRACKITTVEAIGEFFAPYYPFTRRGFLPYVTAPLLMLLISQLGYSLFSAFASGYLTHPAFPLKHMAAFRRSRDDGAILISGLHDVKFRRKIKLAEPFTISILPFWEQSFPSNMYIKSRFNAGRGAITGTINTFLSDIHATPA